MIVATPAVLALALLASASVGEARLMPLAARSCTAFVPSSAFTPGRTASPVARGMHIWTPTSTPVGCRGRVSCYGWFGQGKDEPTTSVIEEEEDEEDEELREVRRLEAILDRRLELGGEAMREDAPLYATLLGLQGLPGLLGGQVGGNFLYFWLTAVLSVYLGAKRAAAMARAGKIFQTLDLKNAVAAPFAASLSLFGTYWILKHWQLDFNTIYQLLTTSFGLFCLRDVLASAVLAIKPDTPIPSSKGVGLLLGGLVCSLYLFASPAFHLLPPHESPLWLLPLAANLITAGIAIQAQGTLNLKSLTPALFFLLGLFCYDVYFVFLAPGGVMESVATSVEGPVKFLSPRLPSATTPNAYPFSILGLGDVVIPGLFVGLLRKFEEQEEGEERTSGGPLFKAGVAGYGIGLLLTFLANTLSHRGQPALLYINPAMAAAALLAAWQVGQWEGLWSYSADPEDEETGKA